MSTFANNADITPQEADKAMQGFYGEMRRAQTAQQKQTALRAIMESQASKILGQSQPWQWMNLVHAACEYLTPDVYGSTGSYPTLKNDILNHPAFKNLDQIYPTASNWYEADVERLLSQENIEFDDKGHRTDKDPLRIQWQNFRRGLLSDSSLSADEKHSMIVTSDLLKQVTTQTAWTALDIIQSSVEAHPEKGRDAFSQHYFFGSEALRKVSNDCPEYAYFLTSKVTGLITTNPLQTLNQKHHP